MGIEDINRDRDTFLEHIQNSVEPELKKIGLVLINVNITDITDESGYIDAIGQKAASQAIQQARGDVADEEKQGEIRVADAEREKVDSGRQRHEAARDRHPRGRARAGGADRRAREGANGRRADGRLPARHRRSSRPSSRCVSRSPRRTPRRSTAKTSPRPRSPQSQATLLVQKAEAYERGEVAQARGRGGGASRSRTARWPRRRSPRRNASKPKQRAKFEAPAKAQKARILVDAEAEAEKRRLEAEGEAAAIYAKLEAEARGQYEILAKKGEGLKMIVDACGGAKEAFQLMMLEHLDTLAESSAKAISNIKFDKIVVWENGGANGRSNTADFLHKMAGTLPPMLQVMRDIGGIEIPESLAKLAGEDGSCRRPATAARRMRRRTAADDEADGNGSGSRADEG